MDVSLKIQETNQLFFNREPRTNNKTTTTRAASGCRGRLLFLLIVNILKSLLGFLLKSLSWNKAWDLPLCVFTNAWLLMTAFAHEPSLQERQSLQGEEFSIRVDMPWLICQRESGWPFFSLRVLGKDNVKENANIFIEGIW